MKQEDKELLLQDLCARLPYKIRCSYYDICLSAHCNGEIYGIENKEYVIVDGKCIAIEFIKPYLFPLSSMTEEQGKEFDQLLELELKAINDEIDPIQATIFEVDFYNKHHLDWRGLIPKGLAIDATGLNIYKEE